MGKTTARYFLLSWVLVPLLVGIFVAEVLHPSPEVAATFLYGLTAAFSAVGLCASLFILRRSNWEWPSLQAGVAAVMAGALLRNVAFFLDAFTGAAFFAALNEIMAYTGTALYCFFCAFLFAGVTPWGRRRALLKTNYDPRFWRRGAK